MSGRDREEADIQKNDQNDEEDEIAKGSDYLDKSPNECERRQAQTPIKKKCAVWVLVFFLEENKHSPPILLENVQDKSEHNGVDAGLKKHVKAQYEVGGKMCEAFIVCQSENKKEVEEKYEKIMEVWKQIPEGESKSNFWHYTKVIGGGVAAGVLAIAAAPVALSLAGFTTSGIAAGSLAAQMMSMSAIANGGGVAAGGMVAALQSAGTAGISTATSLLIGSAAGTAGSALTNKLSDSEQQGSSEEAENQCIICLDSYKMDTGFKPCGHRFTCKSCAERLRKCPVCKKPIQK